MLKWLPVKSKTDFKLLLITFKALHGLAPTSSYIYLCPMNLVAACAPQVGPS